MPDGKRCHHVAQEVTAWNGFDKKLKETDHGTRGRVAKEAAENSNRRQ
jgi:hypothetical protein